MRREKLTLGEQVILELHRKNKTKVWLCEQMNLSRPVLDERLKENDWLICEVVKISRLLELK